MRGSSLKSPSQNRTCPIKAFQESVYTKLAITPSVVDSVMIELKKKVPVEGSISLLTITEKQFSSMKQLLGEIETDVIMSEDKVIKL